MHAGDPGMSREHGQNGQRSHAIKRIHSAIHRNGPSPCHIGATLSDHATHGRHGEHPR